VHAQEYRMVTELILGKRTMKVCHHIFRMGYTHCNICEIMSCLKLTRVTVNTHILDGKLKKRLMVGM